MNECAGEYQTGLERAHLNGDGVDVETCVADGSDGPVEVVVVFKQVRHT